MNKINKKLDRGIAFTAKMPVFLPPMHLEWFPIGKEVNGVGLALERDGVHAVCTEYERVFSKASRALGCVCLGEHIYPFNVRAFRMVLESSSASVKSTTLSL